MAQTNIAGLSRQAKYNFLIKSYSKQIIDVTKGYEDFFNNVFGKQAAGFLDTVGDIVSLPFTAIYSGIKGGFEGLIGAAQSINLLLTSFVNDMARTFDESDGTDWTTDINYALTNLTTTVGEGFVVSGLSFAANVGGLFGIDPNWAYGEDGVIDTVADTAALLRYNALKPGFKGANSLFLEAFGDNSQNLLAPEGNLDTAADKAREVVDARYYDATKQWIKGSVDVQNWVNKNFVIPPINEFIFGWAKNNTDAAFGDQTWYEGFKGTAESIGNIVTSWGVAKLAGNAGLSATGQQLAASSYFAGSIFGNSFNEAYTNGASIQDAYTYATGVALTETAIEQIGGFKPGEWAGESLFKFLTKPGTWRTILSEANQEGWEEVISQFTGTGMSYYGSGKDKETGELKRIEPEKIRKGFEFLGDAFGAYVGGFASSLLLGSGRAILTRNSLNTQLEGVRNLFEQDVTEFGEEKAIEQLNKRLEKLVVTLNKKDIKGIKFNKRGGTTTGVLTKAELAESLNLAGLGRVLTFEPEMGDPEGGLPAKPLDKALERGLGKFVLDKNQKINKDFFKNKMTVSEGGKKKQVVVQEGVFSHNKATKGVDLSDGGKVNPIGIDKQNTKGKKVLQVFANSKAPVVIYEGNPNESGYYNRRNGVVYINQNANIDIQELLRETFVHETTHLISKNAPGQFNKLKELVNQLAVIKLNATKNGLEVEFKDKRVEKYFKDNNIDLQKLISDSFNEMVLPESEGGQGLPIQRALLNVQEELVTYFVEAVATDKSVLDLIKNTKVSLVERVSDFFQERAERQADFGGAAGSIGKVVSTLKTAAQEGLSRAQSIRNYVDYAFGTDNFRGFIKSKILGKYDEEEVMNAIINRQFDLEAQTITIKGEVFPISEVFNDKGPEGNLKRWVEKGNDLYKAGVLVFSKLTIDQTNVQNVISNVEKWIKTAEKKQTDPDTIDEDKAEISKYIRFADLALEQLEKYKKSKSTEAFKFADAKTARGQEVKSNLLKQSISVALAELELSKKTKTQSPVAEKVTAEVEVDPAVKAKLVERKEAAVNLLNRILKRFNFTANSAFPGWVRNVNTQKQEFYISLFKSVETVKDERKNKTKTFEPFSVGQSKQDIENLTQQIVDIISIEVARMYPPIKGPNGEDVIQFTVTHNGLAMSEFDATQETYLKGVEIVIQPTQELLDLTVGQIAEKEENANKTPEERAIEQPQKVGERQKNFNLLLETSKGMVENLVNNVKNILKEVGVAFEKVKVFTNTKGSDKGVFDTNIKDLGIQADNVEGVEVQQKPSVQEEAKTPRFDAKSVPDAFGKKFIDFIQAMAERFPDSTEYNAMDAAEEGRKTPLGTFTINNQSVFEGEYFLWAEYLEFLQIFPDYQTKGYDAYFDYIEKNPKWGEEATQKYMRNDAPQTQTLRELLNRFKQTPFTPQEKEEIIEEIGENLEKISFNKLTSLLPSRFRGILESVYLSGDPTGKRFRASLNDEWEIILGEAGEIVDFEFDTVEELLNQIEKATPNNADSPLISKEAIQLTNEKIKDALVEVASKIESYLVEKASKERPEDPKTESEIFTKNEDLISQIETMQVEGIVIDGQEVGLFDTLLEHLEQFYVSTKTIERIEDDLSEISSLFESLSRAFSETKDIITRDEFIEATNNQTKINEILEIDTLRENIENATSALSVFKATLKADELLSELNPEDTEAEITVKTPPIEVEVLDTKTGKYGPAKTALAIRPLAPLLNTPSTNQGYTFEDLLGIPEARQLIDDIESGGSFAQEAKQILKTKFGYDYKEATRQTSSENSLEDFFKQEDETKEKPELVNINQGYKFSDAQKLDFDKKYAFGTVISEQFTKDYYIAGGSSRETIRYIKQALDKKIRSGEEVGSRTFNTIIKDTGITPGGLSKVLTLLRDLENQSKNEVTPSVVNFVERIIPAFDKNNIVIGMPQANAESVQKAIEEAFKVSPIVAFVVPATWNKYKQQSVIPSNKKLIAWTANGLQKVITGEGQPPINVKTITQIWVDSTDERFVEYEDLRAIDEIKTKSDPFYTSKTLAGVKETYDKLVEAGEEFDLIVRSVGFNEQTDFNQRFTKLSEISPTQTYIAIKINDPMMKDMYLGYLNQIDLNELAKKAPTLRLGFTAEDLAKEFMALVEKSVNNDGKLKKITGMNVNEEQRKRIRDLFGDNIVRDFFVVDKKGNLVLSNAAIAQRSYKQRAAKINGLIITAKVYAMNVLQDLTSKDIQLDPEDILVKNEELNEEEKKVVDFFKLLGVNFVIYKSDQGKNVGGYTIPGPGQTLVFINKSQLLKQPFINEVIIHEFLHQLFLYQPGMMMNFASSLADVLLNPDGTESDIYKQLTDKFGTKGFIAYIKQYGKQNPEFKKIKTVQDIVNVLKDAKNNLDVANELIAQLGGILFTDEKVFQTLLNAGDNSKLFSFYNIYSSVITDTRIPKNLRDATKNLLNKISPIIDERLKEIEKIYPKTRTYTIAELNTFISQFTNGQFTTKKELIEASLEEKANNKRGKATIALDNIIFVSSLFARTVKQNAEVFGLLQKEFSAYKTSVEYILDNPEAILTGEKTKIFSFFKSIFSFPKTFASVIKKAQEAAEDKTGPKVYFNEAEASADGGNVMVGFDILPTKLLDNQVQSLYDFLDEYEALDDNLLIIMGLPSKTEIGDMIEELIKAHEKTLDSMFKKGSKYKDSFTPALEKFKSIFGKQFAEAKVQFSKGSENSFKKLIDLQVKARNSKIDLVATVMKNKLNATIQRIRAQPLQAQSPVNRNIQDLANLISQIISILENKAFDSKTMLLEINAVMKQIVGFLNAQYVDKDGKPIGNVVDSEEAKSQFITSIVVIYKQLASLIGKELMDKKNKTDPYSILNENTPNNPFGMPLSVNDLGVIGETFVNLTDPKYTILRPFSEAQFAKQFANILRLFETKYDSSLSDTPVTHNEYAKILADEINKVDDAGGKLPNLKASGLSLEKLSNVMLPQDFFKLMDSIFGPQGISLFRNFFREYVRATLRRSDILQMFDIEYTRWIKSHKENQKNSVREKVNLDSTILAQMPKGKLQKIDDQVKEEVNALKEQQKAIGKKISAFGVKIKGLTEKIQEIKEKIKRTSKGDKSREILKKQLETLQDEKRKAMSLRTNERGNRQRLAAQAQSLNPVVLKTIKIREFVAAQGKKIKQTISRGHLVSLYLSVVREQEMHDTVQAGMGEEIYPTEHFAFGNQFNILDNERLKKFGWVNARANQLGYTIVAEDRATLIAYLETLLSEEDIENIEFAKERFDANYQMLDEMFFQRYKVHLPRQNTYIPFASSESDYKREFKLKQANRYNIAAPDGMVTATTSGARTILRIENIFSVIENHTQDTANYSFERLVTDWQNLFVNGSGGSTLQSVLTDGTVFGKENGILSMVENSLLAILQYNDITESWFTKLVKQVIRNTVSATMSLNLISSVKQLASVSTVILKNGIQIVPMLKNVSKALFLPSKYRRWLMGVNPTTGKPNNSNFYFRAKVGNVAALAEQLDTRKIAQLNGVLGKATNFLSLPVGWTDNAILVGAFGSLVEKIQKENPKISEEEAFQRANVLFQEVLLYGVANTDTAFRSRYSNRRGAIDQIISRYQSENVMQVSALLADRILVKNKTKGARRKYLRDMLAFLFSALFSALTNNLVDVARGRVSQEDAAFEFWVNELLMDNILGSVPYLNILTNAIEFDSEKVIEAGIEPKLPLITELYASVDLVSQIINSDTDPSRKIVKLAEILGQVAGVPVRNVVKTSTDMVNLFAPKSASVEVMNWYMSRTPAQGLTASVINGDKKAIEVYLDEKFSNTAVQNEIAELLASDTSLRLSLRDDDSFVYKNKTYEIPDYQKDKYNRFAQKALQKLINKSSYRRLTNKNKIKAIQRIINYYSNYMRAVISQDRDELNSLAATQGFEDVLERALKFDEEDE